MTAVNTYHGLAGFYLFTDPLEQNLIKSGKLPASQFDFGLVCQDRILDAAGQLFFDCLNHDGFLGDLFLVNGRLQPVMKVQRRK